MDHESANNRCSLEVKHRVDSAKDTDMHEARVGKMGEKKSSG